MWTTVRSPPNALEGVLNGAAKGRAAAPACVLKNCGAANKGTEHCGAPNLRRRARNDVAVQSHPICKLSNSYGTEAVLVKCGERGIKRVTAHRLEGLLVFVCVFRRL